MKASILQFLRSLADYNFRYRDDDDAASLFNDEAQLWSEESFLSFTGHH